MTYQTVSYGSLAVCYTPELVGGGERYGQDYRAFVAQHLGPVHRVFEWCAGPGFIGFSLLAHGLCRSLCLADINPAAVAACRETVRRNGLADQVTVATFRPMLDAGGLDVIGTFPCPADPHIYYLWARSRNDERGTAASRSHHASR
jgi:hypothetical protein